MRLLGIIPARGGSKGIKDKSIAPLAGKPLIQYTIEAAKNSKILKNFIVSTDSKRIGDVCATLGAEVPFLRPEQYADDYSPTIDVVAHALQTYSRMRGEAFDGVVLLQPTSPLRTADDIDAAIAMYAREPGSLISVYEANHVHPKIMYKRTSELNGTAFMPSSAETRRQDFEEVFVRNGALYIASSELILKKRRMYSDEPILYIMPRSRSLNIDAPEDLALAEFYLSRSESK